MNPTSQAWHHAADLYKAGKAPVVVATIPADWQYNATVVAVHDGDSLTAAISSGPISAAELTVPIRTLGINAAELKTPGGDAAAAFVKALLPPGTPVVLTAASPDKYAPRVDSSIAFLLNGVVTDLGQYLIAQQWAAPWSGQGPKPVPPWPRTVTP